jgi:hypothetical protein
MSTALAIHGNNGGLMAQPAHGLALEGFEDLGQRDIILPRWSIVQPTSQREGADAHLGQFVRNIDGEFRPALDVVLLKVSPTRLLWSGDLVDRRPECVSRDGVTGSLYGACASCAFNAQVNPGLRTDPAAKHCNYGYTLVVIDDVTEGTMALLGAMGTSVRPIKVLTTQFVQRKRPAFSGVVRFETERITNEKGKFYVLKPSIVRWLDDAETERWRKIYQTLIRSVIRDLEPEPEEDSSEPVF